MRFCGVDGEGSTEDPSTPHFGEGLEKETESARVEKDGAQAEAEPEQVVESVEEVHLSHFSEEVAEEAVESRVSGGFFDFEDLEEVSQAVGRVKEDAHETPDVEVMEQEVVGEPVAETERGAAEEVEKAPEHVESPVDEEADAERPSGGFFDFEDLEEAAEGHAVGMGKDAHEAREEAEPAMEKEEGEAGLEMQQVVESAVEEVDLSEEVAEEPAEMKGSGGFFDFDDLDEAEVG